VGALADSLAAQIQHLETEKARIERQAAANIAVVEAQLGALNAAAKVVTTEVEESYDVLLKMGLIQAVTTRDR
jgi:predicted negative regulator of RcsB-dependent stress response